MKPLRTIPLWTLAFATCGMCAFSSFDGESTDVEAMKAYAANTISPLLEAYRQKHGKYPEKLDELASFQLSERAKGMAFTYGSSWPDGHYEFSFSPDDLAGLTSRWDFRSDSRTWRLDR